MRVSDIMTNASVTDSPDDPVSQAAEKMWQQQTGSLLVMDGDSLLGIFTERDVMKAAARGLDLAKTAVSEVMTRDVVTIGADDSVQEAAHRMANGWIRHLPVVEGKRVVGVISQRDIVGIFATLKVDLDAPTSDEPLVRDRRLHRVDHVIEIE